MPASRHRPRGRSARRATLPLLALALASCVRQPAPAPAPAGPPQARVPSAPRRWTVAPRPAVLAYDVESSATVDITGDSVPARDTVRSRTAVTLRLTSGPTGLQLDGTVDSLVVTSGRAPAQRPLLAPEPFAGTLDTAARRLTMAGDPDSTCAAPARAAVAAVRELIVPLPGTLAAGQSWRDSVTVTACRGEIPVTSRVTYDYAVEEADAYAGAPAVRLRRTARGTLAGGATIRGQAVTLAGETEGASRLWIDPRDGHLLGATGESTTRLTLGAGTATREVTQHATTRITVRSP